MQACGIEGDAGRVHVAELLPQYASLLAHLDYLHSSKQLGGSSIYAYLSALCGFLEDQRQVLRGSSVDYAAMLRSIDTARSKYHQLKAKEQGANSLGSRRSQITVSTAADVAPKPAHEARSSIYAAAAAAAVSAAAAAPAGLAGSGPTGFSPAAAGSAEGAVPAQLCQQQRFPTQALAAEAAQPKAAAAAGDDAQQCSSPRISAAAAGLAGIVGPSLASESAAAAAAAARFAAAWFAEGADPAQLISNTWPQAAGATGPETAAAAAAATGDDAAPLAAAAAAITAGAVGGSSSGSAALGALAAAAAAAADVLGCELSTVPRAGFGGAAAVENAAFGEQGAVSSGDGQATAAAAAAAAGGQGHLDTQLAACWEVTPFGSQSMTTATASGIAAVGKASAFAAAARLKGGSSSSWTIDDLPVGNRQLRSAMLKWVQACGIAGNPGSVSLAELLPHHASLVAYMHTQLSSKQLAPVTICTHLQDLNNFLRDNQQVLQSSSVDYAAMLSSLDTARFSFYQLSKLQRGAFNSRSGRNRKAAAPTSAAASPAGAPVDVAAAGAVAGPAASSGPADVGFNTLAAPAASAAASSPAAGESFNEASFAKLDQQLDTAAWPQTAESVPEAAAATATAGAARGKTGPQSAAAVWADNEAAGEGSGGAGDEVLAADASVDDAYGMSEGSDAAAAFAGRSVSMAGLLHQLQSDLSVGSDVCATCIRHLQNSAACFGGVGLDAIPASLLLTNHIAEVGDRAQQCLGLAGQQDGTAAGGGAECFAVMEEVDVMADQGFAR